MTGPRRLVLAFPGDLESRTGGYNYDRRLALELERRGWRVERLSLGAGFPWPTPAGLEAAQGLLAGVPDGRTVLVDGLALGAMPKVAEGAGTRLDLVALVHHPLCLETGLSAAQAASLERRERAALATVRAAIVTSPRTAATLAASFAVPDAAITVAVPGTDPAPVAAGLGDGIVRILNVGSVIPRKGQALLVEALSGILGDWRLVIAGSLEPDPGAADRLRTAIADARLGDRISLVGELSSEELADHYATSDLVVSASLYEGYGMALAEALARGLPIVAAAGGAVGETVPSDAGLLVPPGDAAALRAALARCLHEPKLLADLRTGALAARRRLPTWSETAATVEAALLATAP